MDITECDICHDRDFEDVLNSIHYSSLNPDHEDDDVIEISPLRIVSVVVCTELRDTVLDLGLIYENLKSLELEGKTKVVLSSTTFLYASKVLTNS